MEKERSTRERLADRQRLSDSETYRTLAADGCSGWQQGWQDTGKYMN